MKKNDYDNHFDITKLNELKKSLILYRDKYLYMKDMEKTKLQGKREEYNEIPFYNSFKMTFFFLKIFLVILPIFSFSFYHLMNGSTNGIAGAIVTVIPLTSSSCFAIFELIDILKFAKRNNTSIMKIWQSVKQKTKDLEKELDDRSIISKIENYEAKISLIEHLLTQIDENLKLSELMPDCKEYTTSLLMKAKSMIETFEEPSISNIDKEVSKTSSSLGNKRKSYKIISTLKY